MASNQTAAAFHDHDHMICQRHAMQRADEIALERRLRLTPVRRRVLEILLEAHRAMGAYAVLERLADEGFARQPPVAYRALDFLVEHGLAHRIRRLNAYVACTSPGHAGPVAILICEGCETVAETTEPALRDAVANTALAAGFEVNRTTLEAVGTCANCRAARDAASNCEDGTRA